MNIFELEAYFHGIDLPRTIKLNKATTITDVKSSVETNIDRAKRWKGDPDRNPSLWFLQSLHQVLEKEGDS